MRTARPMSPSASRTPAFCTSFSVPVADSARGPRSGGALPGVASARVDGWGRAGVHGTRAAGPAEALVRGLAIAAEVVPEGDGRGALEGVTHLARPAGAAIDGTVGATVRR